MFTYLTCGTLLNNFRPASCAVHNLRAVLRFAKGTRCLDAARFFVPSVFYFMIFVYTALKPPCLPLVLLLNQLRVAGRDILQTLMVFPFLNLTKYYKFPTIDYVLSKIQCQLIKTGQPAPSPFYLPI
jgi:hypothetical protein